ncbi:DUF4189 domain-containing protein [Xanthomonas floridensis]|uniref:DUF4189 domain-containing protein n=2 Tax=Xanthomonas floridensis TaxID=1843580 RepID=UPI0009ECDC62
MKKLLYNGSVALIFSLPGICFAEGSCPPGYYPIGGQGVSGCAPMGGNSGQEARPTGEWSTRWGALARDKADTVVGVSVREKSKSAARKNAIAECQKLGGEHCEATVTYKNACIAVAESTAANKSNTSISSTKAEAEKLTLATCAETDCKIVYSDCSSASFNRF